MNRDNRFDVIIIGTGAGGGTLAYHLAPSGKRILLLERGGYLPREKDNWNTHAVFIDNKYKAKCNWEDKEGKVFHPGIHYYVGGNTKFYGAALLRFRKEDFGEIRHHGGISPAWPISYEELEPYYTQAEHLYQVHGEHGIDPTEPPASAPYKYPAVSHESRIQELHDDFKKMGYRPFSVPLGIRLDEAHTEKSACIRYNPVNAFEGNVQLLSSELIGPNGIAFSPDEKYLYVGNWDPKKKVVMRWEVNPDGTLTEGQVFFDMTDAPGEDALDGVKVDQKGNLFVSGPGGIWIVSPEGVHLGMLKGPETPHNMAWGDDDGKTLYMTALTGLYRMRMNIPGVRP